MKKGEYKKMNKSLKVIAVLLTAITITALPTNAAQAKTNEVKSHVVELETSGPIVDGTEDIVSQDTIVRQSTIYGKEAIIALTVGACMAPGLAQIESKAAAYIANTVTGGVLSKYISGTQVKIVLNRYIVRCANGTLVYKVYATYYDKNGNWMDARLAQEGKC